MPTRRPLALLAVLLLPVAMLAGCGDDDGDEEGSPTIEETADPTTTAAPGGQGASGSADPAESITIEGFAFDVAGPVPPGATVAVSNRDSAPHTVTADDEGDFDVRVDPGGDATLAAPQEPGQYPFHCEIHPGMKGTLVVE